MISRRNKQLAALLLACCTALAPLHTATAVHAAENTTASTAAVNPATNPLTAPAADSADSTSAQLSLTTTVPAGLIARDIVLDNAKNRAYLVVDRGANANGAVTWLDTVTNQEHSAAWELAAAAPSALALSPDGSKLYVAHYRNTSFSVIDTATGAAQTFTGIPKYVSGIAVDSDTGAVYVYDSKGLYPVDVAAQSVGALIKVSNEKFSSVQDVVYDSANKVFWITEGRAKVLTAFSTQTGAWVQDLALPLAAQTFAGQELGGRPGVLELDPVNQKLYIVMHSSLKDEWKQDRILTFDTKRRLFEGEQYLTVGTRVYDLSVNSKTGEVYAANGHDNTVSLISPDTWQPRVAVDFNAAGVTSGTGSGDADTWGLATSADGTKVYVSHPYRDKSRVSVLQRSGAVPVFTARPATPGQGEPEPEQPAAEPWAGPAAAVNAAQPGCAVPVGEPTLSWGVNDYTAAWTVRARQGVTKNEQGEFVWADGSGWYNPHTGEAELSWGSGFHIQHYETLVPDLVSTWGNPQLTVRADKSATLTMDIYWATAKDQHSDGFKRVPVATFKQVEVLTAAGELVVYGEPEWANRAYTRADGEVAAASWPAEFIDNFDPSMRPWWYASGAQGDANKPPKAIFAGGKVGAPVCPLEQQVAADRALVAPGDTVAVTASGFKPDTAVVFELHSNPVTLGTVVADAAGDAKLTFTVPEGTAPGAHTVVAAQPLTGLRTSTAVTVTPPPAPEQPGAEQPGAEQPGTEQPGTEQPGTDNGEGGSSGNSGNSGSTGSQPGGSAGTGSDSTDNSSTGNSSTGSAGNNSAGNGTASNGTAGNGSSTAPLTAKSSKLAQTGASAHLEAAMLLALLLSGGAAALAGSAHKRSANHKR